MIERLPLLAWPTTSPQLTILSYHRVLAHCDPLRPGEVDAVTFDRQMSLLSSCFSVMPLPEAAPALRQGRLPRRACCITFDDGYADNLTVAAPILARYGLPATVFVATGYLDGGRMFNDTVIDFIASVRSSFLDLDHLGLGHHRLSNDADRRGAIAAVLAVVRFVPPAQREYLVARMLEAAPCGPLPTNLMLTSEQLKELSCRGFEIGGHTVSHTVLTTLDDATAMTEIGEGKHGLEGIVGKKLTSFAYPNGRPAKDYGAAHVAMIEKLGFELAVTTAPGVARSCSDLYQLPRFAPWGRSATLFAARMTRNARAAEAIASHQPVLRA